MGLRGETAFGRVGAAQFVQPRPNANAEAGQHRGAEGGCLQHARPVQGDTGKIRLHLQQQVVGGSATIDADIAQWRAHVRRHRFENVALTVGDGFQRRACQMRARAAAAEPVDQAARLRPPVRRTQPGMGGNDGDAAAVGHAGGERFDLPGMFDDAQAIAQPCDQRSGDISAAFQRVGNVLVELPGDGAEHAVTAGHRRIAGIEQDETAGTVGDLALSGIEAALAEQGRLLIAGNTGNRQAIRQFRHIMHPRANARTGREAGQLDVGNAEATRQFAAPFAAGNIEQQGAAGIAAVGQVLAAEPAQQVGVGGAKAELACAVML